jgi:hypothetical protein
VADELLDWAPLKFADYVMGKLPSPVNPATGVPVWEKGVRLHGAQRWALKSRKRFKILTGGVRAGKSFLSAVFVFIDIMWRYTNGFLGDLYWLIGPTYELCKEEMRHLSRLLTDAGVPHKMTEPKDDSWVLEFYEAGWTTTVETKTSTSAARIAARAPRGVVLCEANQHTEEVWTNAKLRVLETGGWVLAQGTWERENGGPWMRMKALNWPQAGEDAEGEWFPLPTWENVVVFPKGEEDPQILEAKRSLPPPVYAEKLGGVPQKRSELVMAYAEREYQVQHRYPKLGVSFEPDLPVYLFSDPGTAHAYATFAVQFWDNICWVIDSVYRWNRTAEQIIQECAQRPWSPNVEVAVMDFAARQRRAEGAPVVEQWATDWFRHTGQRIQILTQPVPLHAGYEIHNRALLNTWPEMMAAQRFNVDGHLPEGNITDPLGPRLMFAPEAAVPLFGGMVDGRLYAGEYNLHRNRVNPTGTVISDDPIDQDNDAIKALNYGLYWYYGPAGQRPMQAMLLAARGGEMATLGWTLVA